LSFRDRIKEKWYRDVFKEPEIRSWKVERETIEIGRVGAQPKPWNEPTPYFGEEENKNQTEDK